MMDRVVVDRVFCYSTAEAKKNGNSLSIGKMILQVFLIVIIMMIPLVLMPILLDEINGGFILIYTFIFIGVLIFYIIKQRGKIQAQLTGIATVGKDIYIAQKLNNGEDLFIGGMAAGSIIENFNQALGDAIQGVGSVASLYAISRSSKIMQNPEIIAKMVEYAKETTGASVFKILKIYNYREDLKKIKITCDYMIMYNGKIKQNKKITIYKSYNCMNDLLSLIKGGSYEL